MNKAIFFLILAAGLQAACTGAAQSTDSTASTAAASGTAQAVNAAIVHRLKSNDAVLPRWAIDLGYRYARLNQAITLADQSLSFGPNTLSSSRFGTPTFTSGSGSGSGGDILLSYFFGRARRFGIGFGAQYMRYTGTMRLDTFIADYQSTDTKGRIFRQIVRSNAPFSEEVEITNVNIPLLLRFKHQFGRADRPSPFGIWADAGAVAGLYNETKSSATGAFSYEAVYKLSPDKQSVVSGFDGSLPPDLNTSLVLTEAAYKAANSDGNAAAYFENLHLQGEAFNVGLNKGIAPSMRAGQKSSYNAISIGAMVQGGVSYQLSYHVTFMLGGYYMYQSWRNTDEKAYRFTDGIVDEGGASYASYKPVTGSVKRSDYSTYGITAGFRLFFGEKKDVDGDRIPDGRDKCRFLFGLDRFGGCPDTDADGITDAEDACPDIAGLEETGGCPDDDADGIANKADKCPGEYGELRDGCPVNASARTVAVDSTLTLENGAVLAPHIVLQTDVLYFDFAKADIQDSVAHVLDNAARVLSKEPKVVLYISGHTDDKGSEERNLFLSYRRANSARLYLERKGIARERVIIGGYGKDQPAQPNNTDENRAKNRRADLKLLLPL